MEEPDLIIARDVKRLCFMDILVVKVLLGHCQEEKTTWEIKGDMWAHYPHMFEPSDTF